MNGYWKLGKKCQQLVLTSGWLAVVILVTTTACGEEKPKGPSAEQKKDQEQPSARIEKDVLGWKVRVDERLLAGEHSELGTKSVRFLEGKLFDIVQVVPASRVAKLREVTIVLDLACGELRAMQYHPSADWLEGNGYSRELAKCVHIPMAAQLATVRNINQQPWVILHELAHAFHDQHLGFDDARVIQAYKNYVAGGQGEKTLLYSGARVKHYALTNHKEFFAEMTESYFGSNDFYPFNRAELRDSEPELLKLLTEIWSEPAKK